MIHTHSKIWIHLVWSTKKREFVFNEEIGSKLYHHILFKAKNDLGVPFEILNIQPEHIHALIDLPTNIMLADFVKKIKGESSHWLNKGGLINSKFNWQRGFGAYSVSASQLDIVKRYIKNQREHHKKRSFFDEYEEWKKEYGIYED